MDRKKKGKNLRKQSELSQGTRFRRPKNDSWCCVGGLFFFFWGGEDDITKSTAGVAERSGCVFLSETLVGWVTKWVKSTQTCRVVDRSDPTNATKALRF